MDHQTADEILACLVGERTVFPYYRDRYSVGLLRHLSRRAGALRVSDLRQSPFAPLLQKPRIREAMSRLGRAAIDEPFLSAMDHDSGTEHYLLSLGTWGCTRRREHRWQQTSRPGVNLVLQLNLNNAHDSLFRRLGGDSYSFNYSSAHPVSRKRNTLAWARIDLDWKSGTALIEEIQSDWVRELASFSERVSRRRAAGDALDAPVRVFGLDCSLGTAERYCQFMRERHVPIWAEAILWAAIVFIREELGLSTIYYHSDEGGALLKSIRARRPPRSLYTDLPRRFCFSRTEEPPVFLAEEKSLARFFRSGKGPEFFRLDMSGQSGQVKA